MTVASGLASRYMPAAASLPVPVVFSVPVGITAGVATKVDGVVAIVTRVERSYRYLIALL
jgi:hypothetical protein